MGTRKVVCGMRVGLSKRLRFEIFKRDSFLCRYCGRGVGPDVILEVDHVIPVVSGGTNDSINLVTACFDCNRGKSKVLLADNKVVMEDPRQKKRLLKEQKEQVAAFFEFRDAQHEVALEIAQQAIAPVVDSLADPENDIPKQWLGSVRFFLKELSYDEVHRAAEIAAERFLYMGINDPFLYFCGICRKAIREKGVGECL